jgi:hypothetical protein
VKSEFIPALNVLAKDRMTSEVAEIMGRQCLHCVSYLEFREPEGYDYGVCLNRDAKANGLIVFEHFGCQHHAYKKPKDYR